MFRFKPFAQITETEETCTLPPLPGRSSYIWTQRCLICLKTNNVIVVLRALVSLMMFDTSCTYATKLQNYCLTKQYIVIITLPWEKPSYFTWWKGLPSPQQCIFSVSALQVWWQTFEGTARLCSGWVLSVRRKSQDLLWAFNFDKTHSIFSLVGLPPAARLDPWSVEPRHPRAAQMVGTVGSLRSRSIGRHVCSSEEARWLLELICNWLRSHAGDGVVNSKSAEVRSSTR